MIKNILSIDWIKEYKKEYFPRDISAGFSVAAIALPVGIAYAGIAGLPPETGLYSCIIPMLVYAFFGSSRQLILGPDAATCLLIASSLAPLAAVGTAEYESLSIMLALMAGILCVLGGLFNLGFLADFLSKPILTGYMNGLSITIIVGQLGKFLGFPLNYTGFLRTLAEFFSRVEETHVTTFLIGLSVFIYLRISKKFFPKFPAPLFAVIASIFFVIVKNYDSSSVAVVGHVPKGFPSITIPSVGSEKLKELFADSAAIVLISFCSAMLTNKSFAVKNHYSINPNKDFIALGISNFFSGLFHGFVTSGADSRTAVNDSAGGKTQLVSVVASFTIVIVILFFTDYLQYLPVTTLSAIIISATIGLFNISYLKKLFIVSRNEFWLAIITLLSVITLGVIQAVLIAIGLALLRILARASRPKTTIIAKMESADVYQDIDIIENPVTFPGILILRFEAPLLFFNAEFFKNSVLDIISQQKDKVRFLVFDASSILITDITASETVIDLKNELKSREIELRIAKARKNVSSIYIKSGIRVSNENNMFYETVNECVIDCLKSLNEPVK